MRISSQSAQIYRAPDGTSGEKAGGNFPVRIVAATGNMYKILLPGGDTRFVSASNVESPDKRLRQAKINATAALTDAPQPGAPVIASLQEGSSVEILGAFGNYQYIRSEQTKGWISREVMSTN